MKIFDKSHNIINKKVVYNIDINRYNDYKINKNVQLNIKINNLNHSSVRIKNFVARLKNYFKKSK